MEKHKVLDQLLEELQRFLLILDRENLSGNATVQKGMLSDLLQSYRCSNELWLNDDLNYIQLPPGRNGWWSVYIWKQQLVHEI
ncbi:unnamed protein product [Oncorhynchus mykiss]|uniref:Uncharacterized protein n=1 Tax=Oncorhynchus mykiss TaxID=8022 RepID=A0A060WV50_ONCMY|nr:unnamed protein product [Oncorhynchus mykiss]